MTKSWTELGRVAIDIGGSGRRMRVEAGKESEAVLVLEEPVSVRQHPSDVTKELTAELVKSGSSGGYYVRIMHSGKFIMALGIDKASSCRLKEGYRIAKAENASVSFRVYKEGGQ